MRIVVDIPYWLYFAIMDCEEPEYSKSLGEAVRDGTPLPKGDEKLIVLSEDAVKREQVPLSFSCQNWISEIGLSNATVAIIEADEYRWKG